MNHWLKVSALPRLGAELRATPTATQPLITFLPKASSRTHDSPCRDNIGGPSQV